MVNDEPVGRKLIQTSRKGKEIMYELPSTPTKERHVVATNYKRAIVNGKAKIVEDVGHVQENVDVGIKKDVRRRTNVLGLMAPGTGYSLKDKNKAKPDKTEHGFEKSMKNRGQKVQKD
ncbi:hypothetical protein Tco_0057785 [Tanacetum coccineum]